MTKDEKTKTEGEKKTLPDFEEDDSGIRALQGVGLLIVMLMTMLLLKHFKLI